MSVIPCQQNAELKTKIVEFAEVLKTQSHQLGEHGLTENEFYNSGLFRGAVERIRGQFSATMSEKRDFVRHILNHMQDGGFIQDWNSSGSENRHDYTVTMPNGRTAVIELKGCLDGNNTNIFERPPHAHEFIIWSVCTNPGADPQHNAWSGIHTRLSAEIISRSQRVDGLLIWDMVCGTLGRPCPKLSGEDDPRITSLGHYRLPPPCIYMMPATIPSPRNNPNPAPQQLQDVGILQAFSDCFQVHAHEVNSVAFTVSHVGAETVRTTTISRNGIVERQSGPTAIRRTLHHFHCQKICSPSDTDNRSLAPFGCRRRSWPTPCSREIRYSQQCCWGRPLQRLPCLVRLVLQRAQTGTKTSSRPFNRAAA